MLSPLAKQETMTITAIGVLLSVAALLLWWWWLVPVIVLVTAALLAFFRDTDRRTPTQRGVMTAPSDGRISSVHEIEHYAPLDGPATCVRIFMSVFDGHINYSPYHSEVTSIAHKDGAHLNTLKPESAEDNESNLIVLVHPTRGYPMAAVRQVAGMLAQDDRLLDPRGPGPPARPTHRPHQTRLNHRALYRPRPCAGPGPSGPEGRRRHDRPRADHAQGRRGHRRKARAWRSGGGRHT
ncbi:phosphatidylserine decarboxylase [Phycisphaeraceae bacterium D3-23]